MLKKDRAYIRAVGPLLGMLLLWTAVPWCSLSAQDPPDTTRVSISGTLFDSQTYAPVVGAAVRFSGTDFTATSDDEGAFILDGLVRGNYLLVADARGYQQLRVSLRVERTGTLGVPMEPLTALPEPVRTTRILGRVREAESSRPVVGAEVTFAGVMTFQVTDGDGRFEFPSVPEGFSTLTVRYMGRESISDDVEVMGPGTLELDIRLAPDPVELEPMVVTVSQRTPYLEDMGFYERISKGYSGQFLSREAIEERRPRDMGDLFQSVPGVRVDFDGLGGFVVRMRRAVRLSGGDGCYPKLLIDDVPNELGWLQNLSPDRVDGIEVYSGANTPLRYNDPCGVILIWTRRGGGGDRPHP